jgi:RNA polymerase sigma-70 factor (ECF subfamily)
MFTIVRRECLRLIERNGRVPAALGGQEDSIASEVLDPEAAIIGSRSTHLLAEALGSLDPTYREVLLLRDVEELSAPEAASRLGISVQALKSRLHRARASLRDRYLAASSEA